jgi:hypothetical protein
MEEPSTIQHSKHCGLIAMVCYALLKVVKPKHFRDSKQNPLKKIGM